MGSAFLFLFRLCCQILEKGALLTGNRAVLRFCFSLFATSLLSSKLVHLYAHASSISIPAFLIWGCTFFLQDVILIAIVWFLSQQFRRPWARIVAPLLVIAASLFVSAMAAANISFFVTTGAEIHWRSAKAFHTGPAALKTLLSEAAVFIVALAGLMAVTGAITSHVYQFTGEVLAILVSSIRSVFRCRRKNRRPKPYQPVPITEEDCFNCDREDGGLVSLADFRHDALLDKPGSVGSAKRLCVLAPTVLVLALSCVRPGESAYSMMSLSLPFSPFTSGGKNQPIFADVRLLTAGNNYYWLRSNMTALSEPPDFDFLPSDEPVPGFRDWYPDSDNVSYAHYNPTQNPLHISNLHNDVLEPLREALNGKVKIKHIFLIKMESTRGDLFPLRKESFMWDRIAKTYPGKQIPTDVEEQLANLTRNAEYLTGFTSGLEDHGHRRKGIYGGISASNAVTTCTYTVKSLPGTICGVSPLVVNLNKEYLHHVYQPCLPQILDLFSRQPDTASDSDDFTSWPWRSVWMQSVTDTYDHQGGMLPAMGFHNSLNKEAIEDRSSKHYPPNSAEVNYYGYPDTEIKPYLHDAIKEAKANNQRLLFGHLTGTTHHAWGIPNGKYLELLKHSWIGANLNVNRYLNAVRFQDRWIGDILDLLEDTGIADETLLIFTGDHATALPNDGSPTPYDNPHIGNFHVPLVFSHPHLPPVHVDNPVILSQVVPTVLDLLIESASLSPNATHAAKQLLPLYEGQSIIRPLIAEETSLDENQNPINKHDWQFSVMNTGGSWLALRSADKPDYRLVVPLIPDLEWRFTDLQSDPNEVNPIMEFDVGNLVNIVARKVGQDAADWIGDAARVTRWWVPENHRRWEYDPFMEHNGKHT